MDEARGRVGGAKSTHDVMLYGLSTCGWCAQAKEFLTGRGVAFDYVFVDLLEGGDLEKTVAEIKTWLPEPVFPLIVVDGSEVIAGFREDRLVEALGL